nr:11459_t:CDS:2 [Entrophospora candida]
MSISSIGDLLPDNVNSLILGEHERRGSDSDITFPLRHPLRPSFKQKFRAPLLELNRYKYIVNVSILENKGAGVRRQLYVLLWHLEFIFIDPNSLALSCLLIKKFIEDINPSWVPYKKF